jgi:PAS domain S-box-containing protein
VQDWNDEWRKTAAQLERQLAASRKTQERSQAQRFEAERRAAALETANAELQEELDKFKRVEKTRVQQQQALESSKAVLELHVQTRTKELQKLQRRYEHILNSAGEGICGLDAQGKTIFANPAVAKLTGWTPEELVGKTEQDILGRNGDGQSALAGRQAGEGFFHRKDGTAYPVEFVRTPINENGQVVGAVLVFKDITQRKQVEDTLARNAAELARSNAELEQFAFVASHDLQEPLRKIQAFGDRLKTKCDGNIGPDARDYLDRMQSAAARMRRLIDDLLTFSRVIRSAEPFVPVDLAAVTREVLGDLELRLEKSGAKVEVGELPVLEADPMQMRQLLLNVIGNSLKFQRPGSVPVVKIQSRIIDADSAVRAPAAKPGSTDADGVPTLGQLCELSIQDNGIGFEEKYTEKIFAVFQRLHGRTEYEGTGVGLAVCRRIAERHHGTIVGRSKPGEGATFIITLPLRQPKPPAQ